jgi:hypothetical protein
VTCDERQVERVALVTRATGRDFADPHAASSTQDETQLL